MHFPEIKPYRKVIKCIINVFANDFISFMSTNKKTSKQTNNYSHYIQFNNSWKQVNNNLQPVHKNYYEIGDKININNGGTGMLRRVDRVDCIIKQKVSFGLPRIYLFLNFSLKTKQQHFVQQPFRS
jgi:hypothetical protein